MPLAATTITITEEISRALREQLWTAWKGPEWYPPTLKEGTRFDVPKILGKPNPLHGKGRKGWATFIHSRITRNRPGGCERCGSGDFDKLQACHILTRSYSALRVDDRNLICMCASCHREMTDDPLAFAALVKSMYGAERGPDLRRVVSEHSGKVDWDVITDALRIRARMNMVEL